MKPAVYARVSTVKEEQEHGLATQVHACREFLRSKNLPVDQIVVFEDQASGKKATRPGLKQMMHQAAMKRFRALVVFKLDRLTRGGIPEMFNIIRTLDGYGVRVYSVSETWFDPDNPTWDLILSVLAWAAAFESRLVSERVAAGISARRAEAKERGETFLWGRARVSKAVEDPTLPARALELHSKGLSWSKVAQALGVRRTTARRLYRLGQIALGENDRSLNGEEGSKSAPTE